MIQAPGTSRRPRGAGRSPWRHPRGSVAATAGPDWDIKDTPRTYVYLGQDAFTYDNWLEGLKVGSSFITKGPMIFLTVNGKEPGARLNHAERPMEVTVEASAMTPEGPIPVEIIVNGEVVAQGKDIHQTIKLDDSAWIAARCSDAHTNPVYVTLEGRPRGFAKEAEEFMRVVDRLAEWGHTKGLFETRAQKEAVLDVIAEGRAVFESIAQKGRRH